MERNVHQKFQKEYPYLYKLNKLNEEIDIIERVVDATTLISPWRLDFMSKLLVAEGKDGSFDKEMADLIYKEHLMAFSDGVLIEAGQIEKRGLKKYCEIFHRILCHASEKNEQLVDDWYAIPVDKRGLALDGAHRTSAAIYYKQPVKIYYIDIEAPNYCIYDYAFFRRRCMPESYIFEMVLKYIKMRKCCLYVVKNVNKDTLQRIHKSFQPLYIQQYDARCIVLLDEEWEKVQGISNEFEWQNEVGLKLIEKDEILDFLLKNKSEILKENLLDKIKRRATRILRFVARLILTVKDILSIER